MLNFYECHFEYNGVSSRDYNLIFACIETSRFRPIVGVKSGAFLFNRKEKANELIGDNYEDTPLSIEVEIVTCDGEPFDLKTLREVERWLFTNSLYRRLYIDMDDDKYGETYELIDGVQKRLYFNCRFLAPEKIESRGGVIGFKCTLETDSMMLWQDETSHLMLFNSEVVIQNGGLIRKLMLGDVDMDGYITAVDAQLALQVYTQVLAYPDWSDRSHWANVTDPPLTDDQLIVCDMAYTSTDYAQGNPPLIEADDPQIILNMYVADLVYIPENKKIITIDEETGDVVIVEDPAVKAPIIEVDTDIDGYTYPVVTFYTGKAGGDISIVNLSDDPSREMEFKSLPANQKVVVDSHTNVVSLYSDDGVPTGLYKFMTKKNFPRLVSGRNELNISGDIINIEYTWQNRRFL